jgi:hypothetical protein
MPVAIDSVRLRASSSRTVTKSDREDANARRDENYADENEGRIVGAFEPRNIGMPPEHIAPAERVVVAATTVEAGVSCEEVGHPWNSRDGEPYEKQKAAECERKP